MPGSENLLDLLSHLRYCSLTPVIPTYCRERMWNGNFEDNISYDNVVTSFLCKECISSRCLISELENLNMREYGKSYVTYVLWQEYVIWIVIVSQPLQASWCSFQLSVIFLPSLVFFNCSLMYINIMCMLLVTLTSTINVFVMDPLSHIVWIKHAIFQSQRHTLVVDVLCMSNMEIKCHSY